ncbi:MAG: tRNA (N(6)-L-threonylcarbamoyladenosine(37)-C(2))-methylthiotransferase MtaB, partial [Oscillospiraceae bacterium]|nr:tRNA (N(6)-L-threonylcarbamoyladenosine(37)-C(2))-methylthiotransferase MtaB [Oscillospiraceae bacterium]
MKVRFVTLGCKVNQVESQALANVFKADGFDIVKSGTADIIVVNSCSVTSEADRKTRQTVRRLRRENPSSVLVLTGCMPQTSPESVRMEEADIVTGTRNKSEIPSLVMSFLKDRKRKEYVIGHSPSLGFDKLTTDRFDDTFQKAYLKIEDGCDRFCSYCIIPYARGEVRSLPLDKVKSQAAALIQSGYREIILTGINLSRYGVKGGLSLADAVEAVNSIEGDFRIRLGSLEPDLITENDWLRMSKCDKLCPHFHLALQSGCDKTLKRMNRRYTTAEYKKVVDTVRELFSGCAVTTDIMVGFPNESDEEFAETCAFVKSLKLMSAHLFIYSPRPSTP